MTIDQVLVAIAKIPVARRYARRKGVVVGLRVSGVLGYTVRCAEDGYWLEQWEETQTRTVVTRQPVPVRWLEQAARLLNE